LPAEQAAEQRNRDGEEEGGRKRRAGNRLHHVAFACAPGLSDQDGRAGAEAHDEGEQEEHHGKTHRDRRQRVDPDHLAEQRVGHGAKQ
jgi:hypothetical protein